PVLTNCATCSYVMSQTSAPHSKRDNQLPLVRTWWRHEGSLRAACSGLRRRLAEVIAHSRWQDVSRTIPRRACARALLHPTYCRTPLPATREPAIDLASGASHGTPRA